MATGRTIVYRRRHKNRSRTSTARNTLPRKSSKEGTDERVELRVKRTPANPPNGKLHFIKPGSRNARKVGR